MPENNKTGFKKFIDFLYGSHVGPLIALLIVVAVFAILDGIYGSGKFASVRNLRVNLNAASLVAVPALGMTIIIIAGGIDLSAGTALTLCATVLAVLLQLALWVDLEAEAIAGDQAKLVTEKIDQALSDNAELDIGTSKTVDIDHNFKVRNHEFDAGKLSIHLTGTSQGTKISQLKARLETRRFGMMFILTVTILTGILSGLVNGAIIAGWRIVPFIVTLGTMTIFLGIGNLVSKESTVYPPRDFVPDWLGDLCSTGKPDVFYGWLPNIPTGVWLTLILALIVGAILKYTVFGRNVFAIGSNESTARLCGVSIGWTSIMVYSIAGLFVAIGGIYNFANIKSGDPGAGQGLELDIIAAVVLGGGSLAGGRGSVIGTLTGAMIMAVIRSGCDQLSVSNSYQNIIIGMIIISAVAIDQLRQGSPDWLFRLLPRTRSD